VKEETRKEIVSLLKNWKHRPVGDNILFIEKGVELILRVLLEKEGL
jgi:hypothetical protein